MNGRRRSEHDEALDDGQRQTETDREPHERSDGARAPVPGDDGLLEREDRALQKDAQRERDPEGGEVEFGIGHASEPGVDDGGRDRHHRARGSQGEEETQDIPRRQDGTRRQVRHRYGYGADPPRRRRRAVARPK